jgi:hypothetical protein
MSPELSLALESFAWDVAHGATLRDVRGPPRYDGTRHGAAHWESLWLSGHLLRAIGKPDRAVA